MSGTGELRSALAEALPDRPFAVELWDGSTLAPTNGGGPTFRVTSPEALGHVLRAPGQLGLGRAYVSGGIDVDDMDEALALLAHWSPPPIDNRVQGPDRARRRACRRAARACRRCRRWSCGRRAAATACCATSAR